MWESNTFKGKKCLNCSKLLHGENFCPNCGQINDTRRLTLGAMIAFAAASLFSSDSRLRNSMVPLLFKPGFLAKEFIAGRRARIVHPLRLFIWFLLVSVALNRLQLAIQPTDSLPIKARADLNLEESNENFIQFNFDEDSINTVNDTVDLLSYSEDDIAQYAFEHSSEPAEIGLNKMGLATTFQNRLMYQIFFNIGKMTYSQFIASILDELLIVFLVFVPFFALWMKLLYIRSPDILLVDHVIFILYNHAFIFFLYSLVQALSFFLEIDILVPIMIIYTLYLWLGFKSFYQQTTTKRLFKFFGAAFGFILMSAIFTIVSIGLAVYSL